MDFSIFEETIRNEIKPRFLVDGLFTIIEDHNLIRSERLPNKGENVAIVNSYPKVAALLYDKLFCVYGDAPEEISINVNSKSYFRQLLSDICSYALELDRNQQESKMDVQFRRFLSKAGRSLIIKLKQYLTVI